MPVPVIPSTVAPVAKPVPPATSGPDLGAGGRKAKAPLFAAALSLILPGTGQVYNGQVVKGLVMAAIYLGSIAIIFGGMVIVALGAVRDSNTAPACFCSSTRSPTSGEPSWRCSCSPIGGRFCPPVTWSIPCFTIT
jgi:hypothetical protein